MNTFREIWKKLSGGKEYRKELVASLLKRGTAMQIQALMKQRGWTQARLAAESGLQQGVISRAQNPSYGNLTFNTVIDIAAGFDVAFIGRFVPFSELAGWFHKMRDDMAFELPGFETEDANANEVLRTLENAIIAAEAAKAPKKHARGTRDQEGDDPAAAAASGGKGNVISIDSQGKTHSNPDIYELFKTGKANKNDAFVSNTAS